MYLKLSSSLWRKWGPERNELLNLAKLSWIPVDDLRDALNALQGEPLTAVDVEQRLKLTWEEDTERPREDFRDGCLAIYLAEKAQGTELLAILGAIDDYVCEAYRRESALSHERAMRELEEKRTEEEQTLISGVDCNWVRLRTSEDWFRREQGRLFRLAKVRCSDWELSELEHLDAPGKVVGRFRSRRLAREATMEILQGDLTPGPIAHLTSPADLHADGRQRRARTKS